MTNFQDSPPLQAGSTKSSLRNFTRRIIRARRAFATLSESDKLPQDEINIPGTHPTAGRAGVDAEIWKTYVSEASDHDKNLISSWNEDLDVLLIFAGLFSAVLTAFIIESRKDLQEDFQKTSANLLRILIAQSSNKTVPTITPFEVASSAIRVNVLWFSSLACSLISALGAMLGKQWVRHYTNHLFGGGAHLPRARRHQAALVAAKQWRMSGVIMTIPILMHLSLFLFFIGLSMFLLGDNVIIVRTIMAITTIGVALYAAITILPSIYRHCPFGTPFSRFLPPFYSSLKEQQESDQHSASDLDAKCLTWLMTYTTSTCIAHSAATAVSGLACTPSQQDILYTGGGVSVLTKALASCTVEENGSLTIRRESLDTASLLLFGAQSLLNTSPSRFAQNDDYENLNMLLKKFDSNRFLDIRSNFNAADSAAAIWCILAHRSLNLQDPSASNELVSRLRKIPSSFEIPAANRAYKELLTPCMHLVLSTQNDPVLCSWAVERMFDFWEFEGRPILGKPGGQILLKALMGAPKTLDQNVVLETHPYITPRYHVNDILSFGGVEPIILALSSWKGNTDAQGSVANILVRVSFVDHGIDAISSAVGLLIQALPSLEGNTNAQMTVAHILDNISSRDRGIDDISSAGFGPLIQALALLGGSARERMTRTFVKISGSDHGVNAIVSGAGVGPLIQTLITWSSSKARNNVVETLTQISSIDRGIDAIISSAGVGPLMQALTSGSYPDAAMNLAKTLTRISLSKRGLDAIFDVGVGLLIKALAWDCSNSDSRKGILDILAQISSSDCGVNAIIFHADIKPIIQILNSQRPYYSDHSQSYPATILARISSSDHGINAIISCKGVGPLSQALTSSSCSNEARNEIAKTLARISASHCGADAIISNAGVESLILALSSWQCLNSWGYVLDALAQISTRHQGIDAIIFGKGVKPIQAITSVGYPNALRDRAAETLAQISSSNRGVDAIISSEGVEPLIQAFISEECFAHRSMARALANISSSDCGIDAIISCAELLIQALQSNEHGVQTRSIILLCRIAMAVSRRSHL